MGLSLFSISFPACGVKQWQVSVSARKRGDIIKEGHHFSAKMIFLGRKKRINTSFTQEHLLFLYLFYDLPTSLFLES